MIIYTVTRLGLWDDVGTFLLKNLLKIEKHETDHKKDFKDAGFSCIQKRSLLNPYPVPRQRQ